jgi:hypothetical protein
MDSNNEFEGGWIPKNRLLTGQMRHILRTPMSENYEERTPLALGIKKKLKDKDMRFDAKVANLIWLIALLALILTGCGKSDEDLVLAEVGGDKITAQLLNDAVENSGKTFTSFEDELNYRRAILDSLVIQRLLIQEAYKRNIDELEEVNRLVLGNRDKFLLDILYIREIEDKINIDASEIQKYYDNLEYKVQVSHILLATKDTAMMVLDSLQKGGNFDRSYSRGYWLCYMGPADHAVSGSRF